MWSVVQKPHSILFSNAEETANQNNKRSSILENIVFTNFRIYKSFKDDKLLNYGNYIKNSIKKLPNHIINLLYFNNYTIVITNKYGSHCNIKNHIIYISIKNLDNMIMLKNYNLIHHEIGHAIDNILANIYKLQTHYYSNAKFRDYQKYGLDKYAIKNSTERFAQGFMSYFQQRLRVKQIEYFEHNKKDFEKYDKRLFNFIDRLSKNKIKIVRDYLK